MDNQLHHENQRSENSSNTTFLEKEFTKQAHWSPMVIFIAVFLAILIVLTTAGNLVVFRLVWVCRRMQIPSFYFVASMSFSDFLMGVLVMPISLAYHINFQTSGKYTLFILIFTHLKQKRIRSVPYSVLAKYDHSLLSSIVLFTKRRIPRENKVSNSNTPFTLKLLRGRLP